MQNKIPDDALCWKYYSLRYTVTVWIIW